MMNKFNLEQLVRENIKDLKPYRSARDDFDQGLLLDANENSFGAPFENDAELHRYPMPYQEDLRTNIADYRSVRPEQVFVGSGSDEAIDLLLRIFCNPVSDSILINPPTYGMYKVAAKINDIKVNEVRLTDGFQLQPERVLNRVTDVTKMIFICSPNNPTSNVMRKEDIITILEGFSGIVVVDEAYIDFCDGDSIINELDSFPNLVVLQTLSKAFGLAGIRLGFALASEEIISYMMKVKAPYNVNKLTSQAALRAFQNTDIVRKKIKTIVAERERVSQSLQNISTVLSVFPSDANFLLFKIKDALKVYQKLATSGVIVRYRGNEPLCENCLRVTIGTPEENDRFLAELKKL